jgi:hypothetical protein
MALAYVTWIAMLLWGCRRVVADPAAASAVRLQLNLEPTATAPRKPSAAQHQQPLQQETVARQGGRDMHLPAEDVQGQRQQLEQHLQQQGVANPRVAKGGSVAADAEVDNNKITQQHKPHKKQRLNLVADVDSSDDEFYDAEATSSQLQQQQQQQEGQDVQEVSGSRQPANKAGLSGAQGDPDIELLVAMDDDLAPDLPAVEASLPSPHTKSKGKVDELLEEVIAEEWGQGETPHKQKRKQREEVAAAAGDSDGGGDNEDTEDGNDDAGQPVGHDGAAGRRRLCGAGEAAASGAGRGKTKQWESEPSDAGIISPEVTAHHQLGTVHAALTRSSQRSAQTY